MFVFVRDYLNDVYNGWTHDADARTHVLCYNGYTLIVGYKDRSETSVTDKRSLTLRKARPKKLADK